MKGRKRLNAETSSKAVKRIMVRARFGPHSWPHENTELRQPRSDKHKNHRRKR
jgi:hypothetical protein